MNDATPESFARPPIVPPAIHRESNVKIDFAHWTRRLLVCNPFYLLSAALLLFGISRLSISGEFSTETSLLLFNFGSLQGYEVLLVVTAILLARHGVAYDATLLVFLECLFLFVPFLLVTQAAFISRDFARLICASGAALAVARFWGLKRFFPRLNLPPLLMACGSALLIANIALPLIFHHKHQLQPGTVGTLSPYGWLYVLPLLAALANLLPRPSHWGGETFQRSYLPLSLFAIGLAATGVHLWRLDIMYDIPWRLSALTPTVWVMAWTLYRRLTDFHSTPASHLRKVVFCLPCAALFVGIQEARMDVLFVIWLLNATIYAVIRQKDGGNRLALELMLISLAMAMAAMPKVMTDFLLPASNRGECLLAAIGLYLLILSIRSRNPCVAIVGGIGVLAMTIVRFQNTAFVGHIAAENAIVFIILHSLRWDDRNRLEAAVLRWLAVAYWVLAAIIWNYQSGATVCWPLIGYAAAALAAYLSARFLQGAWASIAIPVGALVVLALPLVRPIVHAGRAVSVGFLAIGASLVLFALGTVVAWTRRSDHISQGRDPK